MAVTASWSLGTDAPKVISGQHLPGRRQKWTVQVIASSEGGVVERTTIKPRDTVTLYDIHDIVMDNIREFTRDHVVKTLSWTAISR